MPRWRPLTRMIVVANALFALVIAVAVINVLTSNCGSQNACDAYISRQVVGFALVFFMATSINIIMAIVWAVTRKPSLRQFTIDGASRRCPHCWEPMHARATVCIRCHRESAIPTTNPKPLSWTPQPESVPHLRPESIASERVSSVRREDASGIDAESGSSSVLQQFSKGARGGVDKSRGRSSRTEGDSAWFS